MKSYTKYCLELFGMISLVMVGVVAIIAAITWWLEKIGI